MVFTFKAWLACLLGIIFALTATSSQANYTIIQESTNGAFITDMCYLAQSFTTVDAGGITSVDVRIDDLNNNFAGLDLRIYSGNQSPNDSGLALCAEAFSSVPNQGWVSLVLASPCVLAAGSQYTLEISGLSCSRLSVSGSSANPYAGGGLWVGGFQSTGNDMAFRVYVDTSLPVELLSFTVNEAGDAATPRIGSEVPGTGYLE